MKILPYLLFYLKIPPPLKDPKPEKIAAFQNRPGHPHITNQDSRNDERSTAGDIC